MIYFQLLASVSGAPPSPVAVVRPFPTAEGETHSGQPQDAGATFPSSVACKKVWAPLALLHLARESRPLPPCPALRNPAVHRPRQYFSSGTAQASRSLRNRSRVP